MKLWSLAAGLPKSVADLPKAVKRVSLVMFIYMAAWGVLDPYLTIYFYDLFGNYTQVAVVSALLYFFSIIFSLPFGDLADIVSKKKLMRVFLVFYIPFGFILAAMVSFWQFAVFRFYHAFLATGLWSSAESYLRDHSAPRRAARASGFFDSVIAFAVATGAIIGGIIATFFGIKVLFFIFSVFVLSALSIMPSVPDHDGTSNLLRGLKLLKSKGIFRFEVRDYFQIPGMALVSCYTFLISAASAGALVMLPLFSDKLGANYIEVGLIYAFFWVPAFFEAPFSMLVDKFSKKNILVCGGLLSILFFVAAYRAENLKALFILSFFMALSISLIKPVIEGLATELMPHNKIGEFNGVYRSVTLAAMASGSFIIGPLADKFTIQAPFLLGALLMAIFSVAVLFSNRKLYEQGLA